MERRPASSRKEAPPAYADSAKHRRLGPSEAVPLEAAELDVDECEFGEAGFVQAIVELDFLESEHF